MNIKAILFTILAIGLFPLISFAQQNKQYVISGELNIPGKAFAFIEYDVKGNRFMDSVPVINGRFHFKNEVNYPRIANLYIKRQIVGKEWAWSNSFRFFIEPGVINIKSKDSLENAITIGGAVNADYNKLKFALKDVNSEWDGIVKSYSTDSVQEASSVDSQRFEHLAKLQDSIQRAFAKEHQNSLVALYALDQTSGSIPEVEPIKAIFDGFSAEVRNSIPGLAYAKKIKLWSTLTIGVSAPDFALPDTNGKVVSLHDFRGKYVLVDFWASWCVPCRAENPNVLKAYDAFKNVNFTVVGISLDNRRDNWMKAIREDDLPWNQLSDLKGMGPQSEIVNLYDIASIPQNYLIDPNGIIVAKNLMGEELYDKLKEILKNPVHASPEGAALENKTDNSFNFVVECKINSPKSSAKAYLLLEKAGVIWSDSTEVVDGSFTFSAVTEGVNEIAYLKIVPAGSETTPEGNNFMQFYTDAKLIKVLSHGTLGQSVISGGSLNRDQAVLNAALKKGGGDRRAVYTAFIKSHPESYVSLNALFNISDAFVDANELDQLFSSLSLNLRSTKEGQNYAATLMALKKIMVGSLAPDFTMPDTAGRPVSLHDFKGKYVLLDFWASWCTYCREESPYLVKAYAQYQKKGFAILGVSLDNLAAKNKWIQAIRDDGMTWTQVSDLKTENKAALLYSVVAIPHNFLIDPEGIIIARNLRGNALKDKLQELFDN